jgi:hypothetical protein
MTFPLAVILNRLATDFLVLMPFGRRINRLIVFQKERAIYVGGPGESSAILGSFSCGKHLAFGACPWESSPTHGFPGKAGRSTGILAPLPVPAAPDGGIRFNLTGSLLPPESSNSV